MLLSKEYIYNRNIALVFQYRKLNFKNEWLNGNKNIIKSIFLNSEVGHLKLILLILSQHILTPKLSYINIYTLRRFLTFCVSLTRHFFMCWLPFKSGVPNLRAANHTNSRAV